MPFGTAKLNDGNEIPVIAFGTGSVNKGHDVSGIATLAIEAGFSHLDTAQSYRTEGTLGKAIYESALPRSDLYITSKYAHGDIQTAVHHSLEELRLKYLDLYLIHNPHNVPDLESAWREFEKIKDAGFAGSIGVSNFMLPDLERLVKLARIPPAVNQISFSPYNYTQLKPLLEFSAKHGIVIEGYSSLAPITRYPGGPVDAPVAAAAKRLGVTPTQVIILWVRAKGVVVVTTSSSKAHMDEYIAVGDLPSLTNEEIEAIDAAGAAGPPSMIMQKVAAFRARDTRLRVAITSIMAALCYFMWTVGCHRRAAA
ncbi:Aldo-keto reductase [Mycena kentingensis (nom. inval.)]|nr:Aldo-keto reductase [Mycena kentingensis (nom. inval.)]